jgi:uncharacterized protein (DUF433 family)
MASITNIGDLISSTPEIRGGRPCIAGTGVTVHRVASWYKLGLNPDEIAERIAHVDLSQVHAALAYYHANQREIEAELAADDVAADTAYARSASGV